jgi:ABC-type antimicrobial peptide transport system permease subunit
VIGKGVMREFEAEGERQIVGVVADIHNGGLDSAPEPQMFIPQAQVPDLVNALNLSLTPMAWIVRARQLSPSLSKQIQDAIVQAAGLPVSDVQSMDDVVSLSVSRQRFNMWVMAVFGGCALLLAAIGVYGLMAYSVEQRTQEIGIRLALGAQAARVRTMIVGEGMLLAFIGVALGLGAALWLTRFITALLFGVTPRDPAVFVAVSALLVAVGFAAVWLPARLASRVDPMSALRVE